MLVTVCLPSSLDTTTRIATFELSFPVAVVTSVSVEVAHV